MENELSAAGLQTKLEELTPILIDMAREVAWNKISSNCLYIHSEIKIDDKDPNFRNNTMKPRKLEGIMPDLNAFYPDFYDINLCIYKASKPVTIIDVRYYLKSSLDPEYFEKVVNDTPMLHCKVHRPNYAGISSARLFDINWQHNTIWHRLDKFLLKAKFRLTLML